MAEVIRMPRMSDTMEEGNIVSWLKNEGDSVEIGETLAEVETDKATMELDSPEEGVLLHIAVKEGAVPINGVIAVIGKKGEDWKAAIESSGSNGKAEEAKSEAAPAPAEEKSSPAPVAEPDHQPAPPSDDDKRVKASPLAKNLAKDAGIDIGQVEGSGDQGRIVKRDIEAAIEAQKSAPAPQPASKPAPAAKPAAQETPAVTPFAYAPGTANFEEKSISQMRKTIARRLGESKFTAPHFYLTIDINMDKSVAMRKQVNEVAPTKISFNDFVVKAAAVALRQHPGVN
ncbi:MAG TPA: dihydrolipoamide acetyltransferase family protein, partial [Saprospiraceae bacterium]|nr:dihydrolipoamide acetyltransferase family protein [Saprospiraceae bacterium]